MNTNLNKQKTLFVLTRVGNMKALKLEIGDSILIKENVIIDTENTYYDPYSKDSGSPIFLYRSTHDSQFDYRCIKPGWE